MEEVVTEFQKGIFEMCLNIPISINETIITVNLNVAGHASIKIGMIPTPQNTVGVSSHSYTVG